MRVRLLTFAIALAVPTLGAGQIPSKPQETFSARAEATVAGEVTSTMLRIHVERYSNDQERHVATTALETGGAAALTAALRNTPSTGYVEVDAKRWAIRYARQEPTSNGRRIVIVLDQPLFFLGGGALNPKSRAGFELAAIQFEVDATGTGHGTMAAAARIGPGGPTGVELTDYSDQPILLVAVTKVTS